MENNQYKAEHGKKLSCFQEIKVKIRQSMNIDISTLQIEQKQQLAAKILQLDPKERREDEIQQLKHLIQDLDFFTKINSKKSNQEAKLDEKICRRMKYESYKKGQTVIEYGSKADKFFIILNGQVSVFLIKTPEIIEQEEQQLKTGKKLKGISGNPFTDFQEEETNSPINEIISPLSSMSNKTTFLKRDSIVRRESILKKDLVQRRDSSLKKEPFSKRDSILSVNPSTPLKRSSLRPQLNLDIKESIKEFQDKNQIIDQLNNEDSPYQIEKVLEKSKFSNYNPPQNKDYQNITKSQSKPKLFNYGDQDSDINSSNKLNPSNIRIFEPQQIDQDNQQQLENSILNNRTLNLLNKVNDSSYNNTNNSHSTQSSNSIAKSTILQQAMKNNGNNITKCDSIYENRSKQVTVNSNNSFSPQKISLDSSAIGKNEDTFSFDEDNNQQSRKISNCLTPRRKKTRVQRLADLYKNSSQFGNLQVLDVENVEKYFTDSGIFKFDFRDTMKTGCTFGELGILDGKPRSALIVCSEDSEFAIMEKEDYSELLAQRDRKKLIKKLDFLKQKMFPELTNDAIKKIFYAFEKRTLMRNEILFSEGEQANGIFLIKEGEISLSQKQQMQLPQSNHDLKETDNKNNQANENLPQQQKRSLLHKPTKKFIQKIFSVIGKGEYFGEEDLLIKENNFIRQYTATCSSIEGSVYFIETHTIMKFLKQRPTTLQIIQQRLNKKLKWRSEHIERQIQGLQRFSSVDTKQITDEIKMKDFIENRRRNDAKRSSMIELDSYQLVTDDQISNKRSRKSMEVKKQKSPTIIGFSMNSIGSLNQLPSLSTRDYQQNNQTLQGKNSIIMIPTMQNMEQICEERSNDGSPKYFLTNGEQKERLEFNEIRNMVPYLQTKSSNNDDNTSTIRKLSYNQQRIPSFAESGEQQQSLTNMFKDLDMKEKNDTQTGYKQLDFEFLKKFQMHSKKNVISTQKMRLTQLNFENIRTDEKSKTTMIFSTPKLNRKSQSQVFSVQRLPSPNKLNSTRRLKQADSMSFSISQQQVQSPISSSTLTQQIKRNNSSFKIQDREYMTQSCTNTSMNKYQSYINEDMRGQFSELNSPEMKTSNLKSLTTNSNDIYQLQLNKLKADLKNFDSTKSTKFFNYKQFLSKKLQIQVNQEKSDENSKSSISPGMEFDALGTDIFKCQTTNNKQNYQKIEQNSKGKQLNTSNNIVNNVMRKVKVKTDSIDSILRTKESKNQNKDTMDNSYGQIDQKRKQSEQQYNQSTFLQAFNKQSLNSLPSIGVGINQEKSIILTKQDLLNEYNPQAQLIKQDEKNNKVDANYSPQLQFVKSSSYKGNFRPKSLNQNQVEIYMRLKQSLKIDESKKNNQKKLTQSEIVECPNNFHLTNYNALKLQQTIPTE